jgi:hypothetical protein
VARAVKWSHTEAQPEVGAMMRGAIGGLRAAPPARQLTDDEPETTIMDNADRGFADPGDKYDVAILGSHLASSLLAAVIARHGLRVLLVDGPADTTQAAGETTVPYTAEVFFTLAKRFDVPEKRSLGFVYHQRDTEQNPRYALQFNVPGEHSEWHPYRPDVDEHARRIATARGTATIRNRPAVRDVVVGRDEVAVLTTNGRRYRARYVVDALGPDSPLPPTMARGGAVPVRRSGRSVLPLHARQAATHAGLEQDQCATRIPRDADQGEPDQRATVPDTRLKPTRFSSAAVAGATSSPRRPRSAAPPVRRHAPADRAGPWW